MANPTVPSLASVMSSTGRQIINKNLRTSSNRNGKTFTKGTTVSSNTVVNNLVKQSQMSSTLNNTTTQPNFYSPFLTPSSYQIPNTRKEVYLWANYWRNNEPKVAAGINFYTNFPFNGWKLECKSGVVKDYFEKLMHKLNFKKWLPAISQSYHLYGDAFVLASIDCPVCEGRSVNPKTGKPCNHEGASWKSLSLLNPDSVMIEPGFMDQEPTYSYLASEREMKVVMDRNPTDLYDSIPDDVKALIARKMPIKLNKDCIHHFKHAADPWSDYGTSLIRPLFVTLAYKDKLRQASWIVAERHILPVRIVTVGDDNRPASQEDIDSVQEQLSAVANDPNLTLVVPHPFDYKLVGANGQVLQQDGEMEHIDNEILDGMMLNKTLLNGEGPSYGNAQVGLLSMNERLETWRREVAHWIEEKLFKQAAKWNGFTAQGEGGQEELIYPTIVFDDLKLKDNTGILQMLVTAQENGVISAETLIEEFGFNWDQEVERLRFEQGMNLVNSDGIMNTDSNIGFGGVTGEGFGGVNQQLTPGTEGQPGAMPGVEQPGAMPPVAGGEVAPAPAPVQTAESNYKLYKIATETINEMVYNRTIIGTLNEQKFLGEIDKELNAKSLVTGRGRLGATPENLSPAEPWQVVCSGIPMNYKASKELKYARIKEKPMILGYTKLEKELYNLIVQMGTPLAFYAQYEAGPSNEYTLDGAFPVIKLGIEADGEIWHNNPDKIQKDQNRDNNLLRQGWTILRFTDKEIQKQPQDVIMVIKQYMQKLMMAHNLVGQSGQQML